MTTHTTTDRSRWWRRGKGTYRVTGSMTIGRDGTQFAVGQDHEEDAMIRLGLVVRRSAGERRDSGWTLIHFGEPFSSNIVVFGHCLVTLPCTMSNE